MKSVIVLSDTHGNERIIKSLYEIMVETMASGDLNTTIRALCGYDKELLTIFETRQEDGDRYDFVWTTTGEKGDRLGRAVILDDGAKITVKDFLGFAEKVENKW